MQIVIKLFAGAADAVGQRSVTWEAQAGATAGDLLEQLMAAHPKLSELRPVLLISVNQEYATVDHRLQEGDELALIPPVSGGSGHREETSQGTCRLTGNPIDIEDTMRQVAHPDAGAVILFLGTVREHTGERQTSFLDYEAYPEMALGKMNEIVDEIAGRWPGSRTAITHRTGHLEIGAVSVAIAVSHPHRAEAYEASRHAIERLKAFVPIWKKETWADGTAEWVGHS